jgi:integrase/recombinase XerD
MSETPVSPLRARMIEDMSVRKFCEKTQNDYIRHVKSFSTFLGRSPAKATPEDLRRYQVHQSKAGAQPPTINGAVSALRFFFRVTLSRPEMCRHLTMVRQSQKLPTVLSKEEVLQLLEAAPGVKYKAALSVAYGAGLRVSEVANLKVSDIDRKRMLIRSTAQGEPAEVVSAPSWSALLWRSRRSSATSAPLGVKPTAAT